MPYEMACPKPRPVPSLFLSFQCAGLSTIGIRDSRKQCSIHLRVKAVYIQSIAQLKAARISTVGCATFSAGAGSEFDSQ